MKLGTNGLMLFVMCLKSALEEQLAPHPHPHDAHEGKGAAVFFRLTTRPHLFGRPVTQGELGVNISIWPTDQPHLLNAYEIQLIFHAEAESHDDVGFDLRMFIDNGCEKDGVFLDEYIEVLDTESFAPDDEHVTLEVVATRLAKLCVPYLLEGKVPPVEGLQERLDHVRSDL